jgi:hypothetical protein
MLRLLAQFKNFSWESSEGKHLYHAAQRYVYRIGAPEYVLAIAAFIREEQRHAGDLNVS